MMDMNTNTLQMAEVMMKVEQSDLRASLLAFKTKFRSILSGVGLGASLLAAVIWINEPAKMDVTTLLIPSDAYEILRTGFNKPVPSVAEEAAKIPTKLVDPGFRGTTIRRHPDRNSEPSSPRCRGRTKRRLPRPDTSQLPG